MEHGKRKVMWCLAGMVTATVLIGLLYYVQTERPPEVSEKEYLIRQEMEGFYGC